MIPRILLFATVLIATFFVRNNPFFWDTVQLASKHAHYFYGSGFSSLILPETIDSGHPPAFGLLLACTWMLFGKTLTISHFLMVPFLCGIVFSLLKIGEFLADYQSAPWLVVICFADPVLAGQSVLVSPDIPLVMFFLMGLWAILRKHTWILVFAVAGLGLISMRGMALGVAMFIFYIWQPDGKITIKECLRKLLPFIPGGLLALVFMTYHYQQTGWIGYHDQSTWAPSFERVDFQGLIRNLAVLAWRMLDYGRIFYWLVLGVLWYLLKDRSNENQRDTKAVGLIRLVFLVSVFLILNQLPYKGLLAHRYLLPVFLSLNLLVYYFFFNQFERSTRSPRLKNALLSLLLLGFVTGNLWIYPKKISQGWDATLAHLPWFGLLDQAQTFLREENIPLSNVGTAFPNIGPREIYELNGVDEGFSEKDLSSNSLILYSNIMNDFSNEEIDQLELEWKEVFHVEKRGVHVILYQNPESK